MSFEEVLYSFAQSVLMALLPFLASALVAYLLAQARLQWARFKSYQPDLADLIEAAAKFAVQAAEQAGAAQLVADKKEYALEVAQTWLDLKGVKSIDLFALSAAIEASVYAEINRERLELETAIRESG